MVDISLEEMLLNKIGFFVTVLYTILFLNVDKVKTSSNHFNHYTPPFSIRVNTNSLLTTGVPIKRLPNVKAVTLHTLHTLYN